MNRSPSTVVLASASPRRRVMLEAAGVPLRVRPADVPEVPMPGEGPLLYARRVAREKACAAIDASQSDAPACVLASDTVVTLAGEILGKPGSPGEAAAMLRRLAGRTHEVITAFAVRSADGRWIEGADAARVTFRALGDAEIAAYVASGEPMDKAGAYGLQGRAGHFVTRVDGACDTVVGLPLGPALGALIDAGALPPWDDSLRGRLAVIRGRIAAACQAVGRAPEEVTLVAVTKTLSAERVRQAMAAGVTTFGENYVQEWQAKAAALGAGPEWHFIGHLQSNKAKLLAARVAAVHSLDSLSAAEALSRAVVANGRIIDACVQVNVGGEPQKAGIPPENAPAFLERVASLRGLRLRGLMTVPPDGPLCETRAYFERLRDLRDACARPDRPLPWLSMGMSGDFDQAIACGATHIRVGTALFGER